MGLEFFEPSANPAHEPVLLVPVPSPLVPVTVHVDASASTALQFTDTEVPSCTREGRTSIVTLGSNVVGKLQAAEQLAELEHP
mgnify:CR=1 FL=1